MSDSQTQYGLTSQGFVRMRLPEIMADIQQEMDSRTGKTWNYNADSWIGIAFGIFGDRLASAWEVMETVYNAMYPGSAVGVALDNSVSFSGVRRQFPTPTQVLVNMYGSIGTTVASGTVVRTAPQDGTEPKSYVSQLPTTIGLGAASVVTFQIGDVPAGVEYWVTINGVRCAAVAGQGSTAAQQSTALAAIITAARFAVTTDGSKFTIKAPLDSPFSVSSSINITVLQVATPGRFYAAEPGPIPLVAGEITSLISRVPGLNKVENPSDGLTGLGSEDDINLRARYPQGVFQLGSGSVPAIRANIRENVLGITDVQVYENENDVADVMFRPPHSIEVVASGGLDQDIANEIYRVKGGGIKSYGSITKTVIDAETGSRVEISFNRPTPVYVWFLIDLVPYQEETLPNDASRRVRDALVNYTNSLPLGKDLLIQRLYAPINEASTGIQRANIRMAYSPSLSVPPAPAAFTSNDIAINQRSRAATVAEIITVNTVANNA